MAARWEIGSRNDVTKGIMSLGIMKKLLLAILATTALAACSDHTIDATPNVAIEFGDLKTRAAINNADEILQFGVYAQMNLAGDNDTSVDGNGNPLNTTFIDLLSNEKISRVDAASPWTYTNTRYWVDDRTFRFFAYCPYLENGSKSEQIGLWKIEPTSISDKDGYALSFTTPDAADADFITAFEPVVTVTNQENYPTVDFKFEHELTKVSLKIWRDGAKNKNDEMYLKSVEFTGVKKSGTFYTSIFNDVEDNWTYGTETMQLSETYTTAVQLGAATIGENSNIQGSGTVAPFSELILIPQTLSGSKISIVYEHLRSGATDRETKKIDIQLPPATTWRAGQNIVYNVLLSDVKDITLYYIQTTISAWGTPQTGGTVIIK